MQELSWRKPVGTFAGIRKTRLVTVGHRLQWAPFQGTVPYGFFAPLQAWVLGVERTPLGAQSMQNRHTTAWLCQVFDVDYFVFVMGFSGPQSFLGMRKHWSVWHPFSVDCGPENLSQVAA